MIVPAGTKKIEFKFEPSTFETGEKVALASSIILLLLLVFVSYKELKVIMKKVLIITYYWPPSAGAGVQRWLKFSKYLPKFNWKPIIYTPENPYFHIKDPDLNKDVSSELVV